MWTYEKTYKKLTMQAKKNINKKHWSKFQHYIYYYRKAGIILSEVKLIIKYIYL